jgi:hypothetical protein
MTRLRDASTILRCRHLLKAHESSTSDAGDDQWDLAREGLDDQGRLGGCARR